ncbi:oxidoreductase [Saccharospirillum sp. MSK14-1]|uniref:SDR family oxidoreductase n=1 Tax=Saccharospirillum sp. MSK14-1 TaxID=1897632 RepID=UPI000D3580B4|nr:SDR family oxidoreductase [Saccharospirillum sp. MSK14-1]PTY37221.1 oxidoreductase [Saccharospirillum sp. MSK14-1]
MTTLVIGAHGQIGQRLIKHLAASGDTPRAMIRSQEQAQTIKALGGEPVIADLEGDFSAALTGCDKVVFTAGSGGHTGADKTVLIDLWGAIKAVDAAKASGVKQFVMVSSRGAENPDAAPARIKHYTVCKHLADEHLIHSGLTYSILRPGRLTDEDATDQVRTDWPDSQEEQWVTRADVAAAIAHCLSSNATHQRIYPLFHGEQRVAEALA